MPICRSSATKPSTRTQSQMQAVNQAGSRGLNMAQQRNEAAKTFAQPVESELIIGGVNERVASHEIDDHSHQRMYTHNHNIPLRPHVSSSPTNIDTMPIKRTLFTSHTNAKRATPMHHTDMMHGPPSFHNTQSSVDKCMVQPSGVAPHDDLARHSELFGICLFNSVRQKNTEKNVFVAPYSVYVALGMLTAGAADKTLGELVTAMHTGELVRGTDDTAFHAAVRRSFESAMAAGFTPANSIWVAKGKALEPGYSAVVEGCYDACARSVDFNKSDGARQEINEWVATKTEQRIKDLLPARSVDEDTYMVLCNAICFKEKWAEKFSIEKGLTDFHLSGNKGKKKVTYISTTQSLRYFYDQKIAAEIVFVPYQKAQAAAVVILPRGCGLSTTCLAHDTISGAFIQARYPKRVNLTLPKFKMETTEELKSALQMMGLRRIFDRELAQFGRMTSDPSISVGAVYHAAFVAVDEVGTEAAAATAISMNMNTCSPASPLKFMADRPFFFGLVNVLPQGTVNTVFLGAVNNPSDEM